MKRVSVENRTRTKPLGDQVAVADWIWTRLRGLLGRPAPREGEGLLIVPSRGVHMYGMKYSLDVLLLDGEARVIALYPGLAPGERTRVHKRARFALELPVGVIEASGTAEGDQLEWVPAMELPKQTESGSLV